MSKTFDKLQPYMERAMAIHTASLNGSGAPRSFSRRT